MSWGNGPNWIYPKPSQEGNGMANLATLFSALFTRRGSAALDVGSLAVAALRASALAERLTDARAQDGHLLASCNAELQAVHALQRLAPELMLLKLQRHALGDGLQHVSGLFASGQPASSGPSFAESDPFGILLVRRMPMRAMHAMPLPCAACLASRCMRPGLCSCACAPRAASSRCDCFLGGLKSDASDGPPLVATPSPPPFLPGPAPGPPPAAVHVA